MKKTNLKKYILEALGVLLVIAAVFWVNKVSGEKAIASETKFACSIDLSGANIFCSDGRTKIPDATINSIHVKIVSGNETQETQNIFDDTINITNGKGEAEVDRTLDKDAEYTLSLSVPQVNGYTVQVDGFNFEGASMEKDVENNKITYSGNPTVTTTANNISWSASGTPSFYYSDGSGPFSGPSVTGYSGSINTSLHTIMNKTSDSFIDKSGNITEYTLELSQAHLSGAEYGSFKESSNTITGDLNGTNLSFDMSNVKIVTKTNAPSDVKCSVTIKSPSVLYSDGTANRATVTKYSGSINNKKTGKSTTFTNLELLDSKLVKTISASSGDIITVTITGCTLSDGGTGTVKSGGTSSETTINDTSVSITLDSLVITEPFADAVNSYSSFEKKETDADDDIKIGSVTISKDQAKAIIASQTDSGIQAQVINAIANQQTLGVAVEFDDYGDDDDVDGASKIKDKAKSDKSGAKIARYFDISMYLYTGNNKYTTTKITDLGSTKISFKYTVPGETSSSSSSSSGAKLTKYYRLYRYHGGSAHGVEDWKTSTSISFKMNEFSTFGLAYYYESSSSSSSSTAGSNSASVKNTIDTTASANKTSGKSPKTGDNFNPRIWIYLLIVAATIATCAGVLLNDTKDTDEAERK